MIIDYEIILITIIGNIVCWGLLTIWFRTWKHIVLGYYKRFSDMNDKRF